MMYFWFSGKQYEIMSGRGKRHCNMVKTEDGWREFTEQTQSPEPSGLWKDYVLVFKSENPQVKYS